MDFMKTGFFELFLFHFQSYYVFGFSLAYTYDLIVNDKKAENPDNVVLENDVGFCTRTCQTDPRCMVFGFHSTRKECYLYHRFINSSQEVLQSDPGMRMFSFHADSENIAHSKLTYSSSSSTSGQAVDGNLLPVCFRTEEGDLSPYLVIDLDAIYTVEMVTLYNVPDDDYPERLHDINIQLYGSNPVNQPSAPPTCCASVSGLLPSGPTSIKCQKSNAGRFVKIYIERSEFLTLCEVKIFGVQVIINETSVLSTCIQEECKYITGGVNVALNKPVSQSSEFHDSTYAVDGKLIGRPLSGFLCSHTNANDYNPWLQVDLQATYNVTSFTIFSRWDDRDNLERLLNVTVAVYQTDPKTSQATPSVCKFIPGVFGQTVRTFTCDDVTIGRFVRVQKTTEALEICELEIYGIPL